MGDGWTDSRQRTLINFLVIEWVGPLNVVHIVIDNATNYVVVGRLISRKRKHINWSPCAAHCLNLIFKDIGKMDNVAELVRRASKVTIFLYNHVALLSWLRKKNGWTEILRPGATRFTITFIALKSLHDHKHDLQALVTSKFFVDSRYSKDNKSKIWNDCLIVVNLMSPLMRLLRIDDCDERPSMGYVYEGMYKVRLGIKKLFNYNKKLYKPYTEIIKQHWNQQLKKSIHLATYWLNPCFQYDQENFCNKSTIIEGVMNVIDQKVLKGKLDTMNEMKLFHDRLGSFGRELTYSSCEVLQPRIGVSLNIYIPKEGIDWNIKGLMILYMFYNKKRIYDPIDYACIDETDFWIVDEDQQVELDVEELENLLYEEESIPINEVEGSSSHIG
ncbi:hypothetical protein AAG906_016938 [Vitis piasezkii]